MKLELKHLKNYLGTGLKVEGQTHKDIFELGGIDGDIALLVGHGRVDLFDIKPFLLPLSSLDTQSLINDLHGKMSDAIFDWIDYFNSDSQNKDMAILCAPYPVIEWCFENHIDVFSLISAGLAIDKRTIKT